MQDNEHHLFGREFFIALLVAAIAIVIFVPVVMWSNKNKPKQTQDGFVDSVFSSVLYELQDGYVNIPPERSFEDATSTWATKFSIKDVPAGTFQVFYFDRRNSAKTAVSKLENSISLNYNWTDTKTFGIEPEQLAVFWYGKVNIPETGKYLVYIDPGLSRARAMIDKKILTDKSQESNVEITLEKGEHLIEIEFLSSVGSVGFDWTMLSEQEVKERTTLTPESAFFPSVPIWYAGIYEPEKEEVDIWIPPSKGDITLVVSSYEKTLWDLHVGSGTNVKGLLVGSYEKGSQVRGQASGTKVVYADAVGFGYDLYPTCSPHGPGFYCEGLDAYKDLYSTLRRYSGKGYLQTYTNAYSTSSLTLPGRLLSEDEETKIDVYVKKIRDDWEKARTTVN